MIKKLIRREYDEKYGSKRGNVYLAKCFRCKYEWIPRVEIVRTCAACRSPYWDKAKTKEDYVRMRAWAAGVVQNSKYRNFLGKAINEKCKDCGKKARHWEHRSYARPLLLDAVCASCNIKRGHSINYKYPTVEK